MNSTMLNYDEFDLDTARADALPLRQAIQQAERVRISEPETFARIKKVGPDAYVLVRLSAEQVNSEWRAKMQSRLGRFLRRRIAR